MFLAHNVQMALYVIQKKETYVDGYVICQNMFEVVVQYQIELFMI